MRLPLLRRIDRGFGVFLLYALALPARLTAFLPRARNGRFVFLKLKGGGSLVIAMPALLGLRRANPDAEFVLVCAREAKIYGELTGLFDRYLVIGDRSLAALVSSGLTALARCFRAELCADLEPNSLLAAVFTLLTCARRRAGFVQQQMPVRAAAYTLPLPFDAAGPIYLYYDRLCAQLGAAPASIEDCRAALSARLPAPPLPKHGLTLGIAGFTSDFARERMMPPATWAALLRARLGDNAARILIFGSARDRDRAAALGAALRLALPHAEIADLCGEYALAQSAALLAQCDEIFAVDSGLLHIARLLGVTSHSFWGPTMPAQRLRPIPGLKETARWRPFSCSPCVQLSSPPCGGHNVCMQSMAEDEIDLSPAWTAR